MRGEKIKICTDCELPLPIKAFSRAGKSTKEWRRSVCTKCRNVQGRYKIKGRDFRRMLEEQEYCCLICEESINELTARVDHCHDDKAVRSLLCNGCNIGIGQLKHDKEIAQRAVEYLTKFI